MDFHFVGMLSSSTIYDQVTELEHAVDSVPLGERPRKPPQPSRSGGTSTLAQAVSRHSIKLGLSKPRPSVEDASLLSTYSVGQKTSLVGSSSPLRVSSEKRPLYMSRTSKVEMPPSGTVSDQWSSVKTSNPSEDSEEAKAVLLADLLCDVRAHSRRRDRLGQEELMIRNRLARLTQLGCAVEDVEKEVAKWG